MATKTQVATLSASGVTASAITANWTPPSGITPTAYTVGRNGTEAGGGSPNWSGSVPATQRSLTFTNLMPDTSYILTVTPTPGGTASSITVRTAKATTTPPTTPGTPGDHPLLVWRDEFLGTQLSMATDAGGGTWRTKGYEAGGTLANGFKDYVGSNWNISPLEHPTRNPFSVKDSILTITAKRVTPDVKLTSQRVDPNVEWMSGYLVTNHLAGDAGKPLKWRFGYFEFRARIPNPARGMFPALWLFNNVPDAQNTSGKVGAEIDLLEIFGCPPGKPWDAGWHNKPVPGSSGNIGHFDDDTTGWHRYGCEWTSDAVKIYKDGVLKATLSGGNAAWFSTADLGMRINYAIDPVWIAPGDPLRTTPSDPPTGYEFRMDVDYVRVFSAMPSDLKAGSDDPLLGAAVTPPPIDPPVEPPVVQPPILNLPVLESGTTNAAATKTLQGLLVARRADGAFDGTFGANTEAQVRSFQKGVGLPETGVVDNPTWFKLLGLPLP
jgi:hypothetical protein